MAKESENKKQLAFAILDKLFNEANLLIINETCSKNITAHISGVQTDLTGIKHFQQFFRSFHNAFSDIHLHIDEIHAEVDLVDAHATITATNTGKFLGMPATGKEVTLEPVFFLKFDSDGKVAEFSQEMDIPSLME
jgi:predicted ester cyclase